MRIVASGAPLGEARAVAVLVHGRGGSAEDMLGLAQEFGQRDIAYLAPEAPGHTWYPYSFLAPLEDNQPWLSSALQVIADALLRRARKVPSRRFVRLASRLQAVLGARLAGTAAARWLQSFDPSGNG